MSFKNILLAFLCLVSVNIFAQSTTFKGKVFDSETKEPIVGATVQLTSNPQLGSISNSEGLFTIIALSGSFRI